MKVLYFIAIMLVSNSCLSDWLDIKPDRKMVLPSTIKDIDALMNNADVLNVAMPILGEAGTDDFTITDDLWISMSSAEYRNAYVWAEHIYEQSTSVNWNNPYQAIFFTNLALESLDKMSDKQTEAGRQLRGNAHFYRAWSYFQLAQLFCSPFDASDAVEKPGLPLRTETDINIPSRRATVAETYDLIKSDLAVATELLSPEQQALPSRPSKAAAYGLSAIVYLQLGDFSEALKNAESSLALYSELMDYNTVDADRAFPFIIMNKEVLFHSSLETNNAIFARNGFNVIPDLYNEFHEDDLRKQLFFRSNGGGFTFRGSYNGDYVTFNGIGTDEIMLIKAECLVRLGKPHEALQQLNFLLKHRYKTGTYSQWSLSDDFEILKLILLERRKQLIFRGRRWWELRRLNKDPRIAKLLSREVKGERYELNSNGLRYTLPIPDDVIRLSGIEQNPR